MKKKHPTVSVQALLQDFFEKHLTIERNVSPNTVLSYRDGLKLFLLHAAQRAACSADQLDHEAILDVNIVRSFLKELETQRKCGPRTRNQRLAILKSFARYVASVAPQHLERCRRIRDLKPARYEQPEVEYLEGEEVRKLLQATDRGRDRALLLLLYNTGARVQELVDLDLQDVQGHSLALITLQGKGRKQRTCPLWNRTVQAIEHWLKERGKEPGPLFLNAHGNRLTRSGIAHILRTIAQRAELSPRHAKNVTPHVLRHTTAMHLLQADIDITTIAAWLGHAKLETTQAYIEINLRMKQSVLAAAHALPELSQGNYPQDDLIEWLAKIGKKTRYVHKPPPRMASAFT